MNVLGAEENEPLQHSKSTEEILESDTQEEILEESCEEIEKQNLSDCFSSIGRSPFKTANSIIRKGNTRQMKNESICIYKMT